MKVVGVGCGPGMLTGEAIKVIRSARHLAGSKRAIEIAQEYIPEDVRAEIISDYTRVSRYPPGTVILSTGDPMLAGLGKSASVVVPGISSFQIATARLKIPQESCLIIDAHGKDIRSVLDSARLGLGSGRNLFILADPGSDLVSFFKALEAGHGDLQVAVLGDLGYPDESIARGTVTYPPKPVSRLYCIVIGTF
jgi:cobalt-precorrin-7 (C5)-methyltransferase